MTEQIEQAAGAVATLMEILRMLTAEDLAVLRQAMAEASAAGRSNEADYGFGRNDVHRVGLWRAQLAEADARAAENAPGGAISAGTPG